MERKTQFLVPYGIDQEGNVVRRHNATREQRYACPNCGEPLILRTGDRRAQHFAHLGEGSCSPERVLLAVAKRRLVKTVQTWRAGKGPAPRIERECTHCYRPHWQRLPDKVLGASLDHRLPSGRIADVALLGENAPVAVLEVYVPHVAPQKKPGHVAVPWIQLNGDEVIGNPLLWKPRIDRFNPYTCRTCMVQSVQRERVLERIAGQLGVQLPWGHYRVKPAKCYRCRREILVFTWPGHAMWTVKRPPEPIPPTVKFSYTRTTGTRYWANTCPHCQAVQGDWNLYAEPGGAFFEVGQHEDDVENKED